MNISIFGLGYVGAVSSACFAKCGHQVLGVDANPSKMDLINDGVSPIVESGMMELVRDVVSTGAFQTTADIRKAITDTDMSMVCVGTPSKENGDLDLQYIERVSQQIGKAIADKPQRHLVVIRSTVLPGTTEQIIKPIIEKASGKKCGEGFGLCFNPEFLREGCSIRDFEQPPFTIVGSEDERDLAQLKELYSFLNAEFITTSLKIAEMVKYICNSFHALKVGFGNEVGRLCKAVGIDSHEVMDIFCKDTKQNISATYLRPGYAFGGSCLPKDLRAILYKAKSMDVPMEILGATLISNQSQVEFGIKMVEATGNRNVGLLGLAFKEGTDDLRESPLVKMVETLHGRGFSVRIYDDHVAVSKLVGANRAYIEQELPHVNRLMTNSIEEVIEECDTIVLGHCRPEIRECLEKIQRNKTIIDLVRIERDLEGLPAKYNGICW